MKRGISRAGIGVVKDTSEFVQLASQFKFQAIEEDGGRIVDWIKRTSLDDAGEMLRHSGIELGAIGLPVQWRESDDRFQTDLPLLKQQAQAAAVLGCKVCCTYVLPSVNDLPAHFLIAVSKRLRLCADILNAYGMSLALEFVGPHHLRQSCDYPFLWEIGHFLDWIQLLDRPNIGLLLDCYHWHTTEADLGLIRKLEAKQIVHVHINDAKPLPAHELLDFDRLYPGEGSIDVTGFLLALQDIGYMGVVSQEVLTAAPPSESSYALWERSRQAFDRVWPHSV